MGCSNTNTYIQEDTRKLTDEKTSYIIRNEKLERLAQEILDDCIKKHQGTPQGITEIANEIIEAKKDTNALSQEELYEAIRDVYVQQVMMSENLIKEYDIQTEIEDNFLKINFENIDEKKINDIMIIMQNIWVNYPKTQNGICINFSPDLYLEDPSLNQAFFNNLKFNKTFQTETFLLILNKNFLDNIQNCLYLSEAISCNKSLSTLIIKIADDVNNQGSMNNLDCVFEMVKKHRQIQSVVFINNSQTKLFLTKEIENHIIDLFRTSTKLMIFGLFKFGISNELLVSLVKVLPLCDKLKCFGIQSEGVSINTLDDFVMNGIGRSNSLLAVVLGGFGISDDKIRQYMQVKQGGGNKHVVQIFEYLRDVKN